MPTRSAKGVARIDALIGEDDGAPESGGKTTAEAAVPLHDQKRTLRDKHRALVGAVARKTGVDHRRLNAELIKRTGGRVDQATVRQLERRIALLERWRDSGFEAGRG